MHRMRPVLAVTEPTALPTAMSAFPSKAENSDTSSSGMVVAKLTTVAPMINFGMPVDSAIHVAGVDEQVAALHDTEQACAEQDEHKKQIASG